MTFFISLYLQNVVGYDPVATGIRMVPFTVMFLLIAPVAGRLSDRYGSRWFMVGGTALRPCGHQPHPSSCNRASEMPK